MFDFDNPPDRRGTSSFKWDEPGRAEDILPLWVADMDFPAPPGVTEALARRLSHGVYGYTFIPDTLYEAFIDWQWKRNRWRIEREWIVYAPGLVTSLHFAIDAYTREGDGVVIQSPVYRPFYHAVEVLKRRLVLNPLKIEGGTYRMDLGQFDAVADRGTKLLILCSPHNPVARVWTEEELKNLGELCLAKGIRVVSDEIHGDLIMPGRRFTPLAALSASFAANTVTCAAPSKTFNIPGAGSAFVVIPDPDLRAAFRKAGEKTAALDLPNLFSVTAAEAAYRTGEAWLEALIAYVWENYLFVKDFFAEKLPRVRVFPQEGTYVVWLDFRDYGMDAAALKDLLLEQARVRLSWGETFGLGGEGFQRINIACRRETLRRSIEGIARVFSGRMP